MKISELPTVGPSSGYSANGYDDGFDQTVSYLVCNYHDSDHEALTGKMTMSTFSSVIRDNLLHTSWEPMPIVDSDGNLAYYITSSDKAMVEQIGNLPIVVYDSNQGIGYFSSGTFNLISQS